jgi:gas vesicle protein
MTQKTKNVVIAVVGFLGGGFVLAVVGMAAQFWIATEVANQLSDHTHSTEIRPVRDDILSIKTELESVNENLDRSLNQQRRFEEIFMEYLREQAN